MRGPLPGQTRELHRPLESTCRLMQNQRQAPLHKPPTEATQAKPKAQTVLEAPTQNARAPDLRLVERTLGAERLKQAERKARKVAAARARQEMKAQTHQAPGVMAFGGDGPHLQGN